MPYMGFMYYKGISGSGSAGVTDDCFLMGEERHRVTSYDQLIMNRQHS